MSEDRKEAIQLTVDERIIELFFQRSEEAIKELDAKYGKVCRKLSHNILGSQQDAEECVSDGYLGMWNAIPPARPAPLLPYLCKIIRNVSLKLYYKKSATKRNSAYDVSMEELEACLSSPDTVEDQVEVRELVRMIEMFLETLSQENRVIFMRRYWFSDTYQDIAQRTGLTQKNVSVRLTRMRGRLRRYLMEREVLL